MGKAPVDQPDGARSRSLLGQDFATRAASGLVLAAVALGLLFAGPALFAILVGLAAMLASWEWSRMVRGEADTAALVAHGTVSVLAAALAGQGLAALGLAAVAAGAILTGLLSIGRHAFLSGLGVLYTGLPAVALLWLREEQANGLMAVLFVLLIVAASDIGAFLAGRTFGGPKLAPRISPNKTWSGLAGGLAASALTAALFARGLGSAAVPLAGLGALLGLISQMGDLAESAMKRRFGVKDSSGLIPGHGGVMDRIDGLTFAAVAAALIGLSGNPQLPATALLFGV